MNATIYQIVKRYPILHTIEEERRMIATERRNEAHCRELLVLHNITLCMSLGSKYARVCGGINDGFQVALIGMMKAAQKFDLDRNVKFTSYATPWVMSELSHQMIKRSNLMHLLVSSMDRPVKNKSSKSEGDEGTELSSFINHLIEPEYKTQYKIDANPVHKTEKDDVTSVIVKCIRDCNVEEWWKEATIMYFGLFESGDFRERGTLESVGVMYGVSKERIRQVVSKTIASARYRIEKLGDFKDDIDAIKRGGHSVGRVAGSRVYKRIEEEGLVESRKGDERKRFATPLKTHSIISGFSNFYSDRYQEMMRAVTKSAALATKLKSSAAFSLTLQAALQRRAAKSTTADSVTMGPAPSAGDVPPAPLKAESGAEMDEIAIPDVFDVEAEHAAVDDAVDAVDMQERNGYGVGVFEDDGDLDYEVEEVA